MSERVIVGIDPGLDGAVAVIWPNGNVNVLDTPTLNVGRGGKVRREYHAAGMAELVTRAATFVVIEAVHSMPGQGVRSMFSMGYGLGLWVGIVAASHIPYQTVTPQRWKGALMDGMGKEKDASRLRASQLYPGVAERLARKRDVGRADALLIAEWGRRYA